MQGFWQLIVEPLVDVCQSHNLHSPQSGTATQQQLATDFVNLNLNLIMMMEFSDDSLAHRRSIRLQEVAKMESSAVKGSRGEFMVLDTTGASPLRRSNTAEEMKTEHRPSDLEIRSLWRLRVSAMKMDESGHSR